MRRYGVEALVHYTKRTTDEEHIVRSLESDGTAR